MNLCIPSARAASQRFALTIILSATCGLNPAAQQPGGIQVPPAATPGSARPFTPGMSIPELAQQDALEAPPLVERPQDLEDGPRLNVRQIEIEGAVDRPEHAVSLTDIQAILSRHLAAQPVEGYTIRELEEIADDVTLYYRRQGLILAQAFLPAQDVQDGVITLQVAEGSLAGIEVEGNNLYAPGVMSAPFEELLGQPVEEGAIEQALLTLRDFPGLSVHGTFREGQDLGDTELLVRVIEEKRVSVTSSFDNYGSAFTGETRGLIQFEVNNPLGSADRFAGYVLQTFNPQNGTYGGFDYSNTVAGGMSTLGFGVSKNQFDVTDASLGALGLEGEVEQANLFFRHGFANTRTYRANGILDLSYKDAVTIVPNPINPADELMVLSYTFDYYSVGRQARGVNLGYLTLAAGDNASDHPSRQGGSGKLANGSFGKFGFGYQRLQNIGENHALLIRLNGQYSDDTLVSLEQYSIGGPANVRAYPAAEALVDSGGSATLEWIIDLPGFTNRVWRHVFQFSLYADYAGGEINDPLPFQERTVDYSGYGVGLQLGIAEKFHLRLDAATPTSDRVASNKRDPQYYLSASYTF